MQARAEDNEINHFWLDRLYSISALLQQKRCLMFIDACYRVSVAAGLGMINDQSIVQ